MKVWVFKLWPFLTIIFAALIFFYPVFLQGKIPIPADLIVGAYLPWHDYKWLGYNAGVPIKNPLISDIPSVIYPQRLLAIEQMKVGKMPLWNPYMFSGYPLMAAFQTAAFYPLNIFYFLMPFTAAWSMQVMFQPILSGIFTYLFLRNLKIDKLSSLFGSIIYAYSGFNMFFLEFNVHGHVAAFIPLFLLFIDKFLDTKKIFYLVLLSFTIAFQIFAGYPQLTLFTLILCFFWFFTRVGFEHKISIIKKGSFVLLFIILGITLSSVQLIPGMELFKFSQRGKEVLQQELRFLPPQEILTVIFPDYFGNSATYNFWAPGNYANAVGYSSIVGFILTILSLVNKKKNKVTIFFAAVALICLLLVVDYPFSNFVVDNFLLGSQALSMTRLFVLLNFSIAVLAAFGLSSLKAKVNFRRDIFLSLCLIIILPVILGTFISWGYLFQERKDLTYSQAALDVFDLMYKKYTISVRNLLLPTALSVITLMTVLFISKFKFRQNLGKVIIILAVLVELFRFGWKITPFSKSGFLFPETPIHNFLNSQDKPFRIVSDDVMPANMWVPYHLESPDGYDAAYPKLQSKLIGVINSHNPSAEPMTRYGRLERGSLDSNYLDFANVKYVLTPKRDKEGSVSSEGNIDYSYFNKKNLSKAFEDKSVVVLENKQVLNRAFFVSNWESFDNEEKVLQAILEPNLIPSKKIILKSFNPDFKQNASGSAVIRKTNFTPAEINIDLENSASGFLFLSNTYFPGWQALVNGVTAPVVNANYAFQAVPLNEGLNSVKVFYSPLSFKVGALLSVVSFLVLVGTFYYERRKKNA